MQTIPSTLEHSAALIHFVAGAFLVGALLFAIAEGLTVLKQLRARRLSPTAPARPAERDTAPPAEKPIPLRPSRPLATAARETDLDDDGCPQICLLCQDGVEPDEPTLVGTRALVSALGDSDAGKKRSANEDSFVLLPTHSVFAIADGMGGYRGGKVASALAMETLEMTFEHATFDGEFQSDTPIPRRGRELASALLKANRAIFEAARHQPEFAEMGTTLVAARFSPDKRRVYIGHVGDSRCYRYRGARLKQLTVDHTMRHLGLDGPQANELYRAVGIEQNVAIDLVIDIPRPDDIYLLCSDGLSKMVSDERIEEALRQELDLETALYRLIELANDAGGRDNITVIVVKIPAEQPNPGDSRFFDESAATPVPPEGFAQ